MLLKLIKCKPLLNNVLCILISSLILFSPQAGRAAEPAAPTDEKVYKQAVVAADHPLASAAGLAILKAGGNVVDAAVATSFALTVLRPASCGLGGGGFMVIWNAKDQQATVIDYRERAPAAATHNMYAKLPGTDKQRQLASRQGPLAVAVPCTVAGLSYAVKEYGTLDLKTVMLPAIQLARRGVPINEHMRSVQKGMLARIKNGTLNPDEFKTLVDEYLNQGKPWKEDARFFSPQLKTLELISEYGRDGFYQGAVAEAMVAACGKSAGGILTLEDLKTTEPIIRKPLSTNFDGYQILTMPPPSSGGIAIIESFNMIKALEQQTLKHPFGKLKYHSPEEIHLLTEVMKHAFADRAEYLGDADFVPVPIDRLTSGTYASELARRIDPQQTKSMKDYGRYVPPQDGGTSHFSVMDAQGNAVACTETINLTFGSYVVIPKYGIVMNNEMDDFAAISGKPNAFGLIQGKANEIEPGKKPLSSMSPTIAVKDGKAVFSAGASGGPRIISSTLQVLLNMIVFGMTPTQAVDAPRIHHQWVPEDLLLEPELFGQAGEKLKRFGHSTKKSSGLAASQAVSRQPDGLRGHSDPRKHGAAAGY
ncbi:gamma-glutamyltransferase [Gimesia chilikensis]|uniref:Glutathione hydrolase proenzyme n=1 Tax=Gimesia chilikensis TaxID=2605989 RepID=A0A517PXW8_9PLAN|nr:gamma-glutamyltransferase [Gimesia chilikensis]QDT24226.1 Gamma-glutamyltranspeptidase precursor [Gimesia chilikensis]